MAIQTNYTPTDVSYARALLELAGDQAQPIGDELRDLRQLVATDPSFATFLDSPNISEAERAGVLERSLKGKVSQLIWSFLNVLNTKGRLGNLPEISMAYQDLLDEKMGRIEVELTSAHPLSDEEVQTAQQKISAALNKSAVVHSRVDDSIIGGVVLRIQDKLLDASVKYQLQAMREQLLAKMPK